MKSLLTAATLWFVATHVHAQKKEKWTNQKIDEMRKDCLAGIKSMGLTVDEKTSKAFCQCVVENAQKRIPNPSELSPEDYQSELMLAGTDCSNILGAAFEDHVNFDDVLEEFNQTFTTTFMEECLQTVQQRYDETKAMQTCRCILDKIIEKHGSDFTQVMNISEEEIFKITESCTGE